MKKNIIFAALLFAALVTGTSCKKDSAKPRSDYNLPSSLAPAGLTGN